MTTTITISDAESTTTLISTTPDNHDDESSIVTASAVIGFILVGLTGFLVFLKISRGIQARHQHKRFSEWNAKEHRGEHPKGRLAGRYNRHGNKGKNAFDVIEDDEGIPA